MKPKQAKFELKEIMQQKTVSISRLKKVLEVLNYERLEKQYIQQGFKIKRLKKVITDQHKKRRGNHENG